MESVLYLKASIHGVLDKHRQRPSVGQEEVKKSQQVSEQNRREVVTFLSKGNCSRESLLAFTPDMDKWKHLNFMKPGREFWAGHTTTGSGGC